MSSLRVCLVTSAVAAVLATALGDGAFFVTQARLSPARSFASGGAIRSITANGNHVDGLDFVAVDGEGRIVVAGHSFLWSPSGVVDAAVPEVARFLPDGTLDATFGDGGLAVLELRGLPTGLAVDREGRPTIVGSFADPAAPHGATVVDALRLTPDGRLDPEFSADGLAVTDLQFVSSVQLARANPADSSILAVAELSIESIPGFGIVRFSPQGWIDPAYGDLGFAAVPGRVSSLALDASGGAVVAAGSVLKLDASGHRDLSFGTDGVLIGPHFGEIEARAVAIDAEGRIVVLGFESGFGDAVFRFLPSGAPDLSFCERGVAKLSFGIPANADAQQVVLGVAPTGDGPYAMSATLQFSGTNDLGRQIGLFGSLVQILDPADPSAVNSLVRRDAKRRGVLVQTLLPGVAVSGDGRVAYAAGATQVRTRSGEIARSAPLVLAVDLTRSEPVPMPEFRIEWDGPLQTDLVGNRATVQAKLRVANDGRAGAVNARVALFLSEDAKVDPSDLLVQSLTTGALGPRSGKMLRIDDVRLGGPAGDFHGRRLLAVINQDGRTPEADPSDNVAVSEPLP